MDSPESVQMVFNEPVSVTARGLRVFDHEDREVSLGQLELEQGDTMLTVPIREKLPSGVYTVKWDVVGLDGHGADGEWRFAVGTAVNDTGMAGSSGGWQDTAWTSGAFKLVLVLGFVLSIGGLAGGRMTRTAQRQHPELPAIRPWTALGAGLGLLATLGAGTSLAISLGSVAAMWNSTAGQLAVVQAVGFGGALLLTALGMGLRAFVPLSLVPVAEGLGSHAQSAAAIGGGALTALHLIVAGLWVGTLLHACRVVVRWRSSPTAVRAVLWVYARLAIWLLLTLVATGTIMALLLVPLNAWTGTDYATTLIAKLGLVVVAVGLALAGRRALARRRLRLLGRTVSGELLALSLVLAVAAVLVSMPTPDSSATATPPPPARGVAIPSGGLAGQVGVNLVASEGQVVVRLYTPDRGNAYDQPGGEEGFELSGHLEAPGVAPKPVSLRPCGDNCFVGEPTWRRGDNVLTLRVAAEHWQGGTYAALIPWPADTGAELLRRTVRVMERVGEFTLYEAGTSNTAETLDASAELRVTGEEFLANEPYNSGVAPIAAVTSDETGRTRLLMSFPASGFYAAVTLDGLGRIVEETLTGPKHEFHRRFVYR